MKMYLMAQILLVVYIFIVGAILISAAPETERSCPLEGRSFSIGTLITNLFTDGSSIVQKLQEFYSVEQRRARINVRLRTTTFGHRNGRGSSAEETTKILEAGTFFLDTKLQTAVLFNSWKFTCTESSVDEFVSLIGIQVPEKDGDTQVADDFIVGPARLLFFLAQHRDKMKLKVLGDEVRVRNIPCLMYELDYQTKYQQFRFAIFYNEASLAADPQTLPMQVVIQFPEGGNQLAISIDFAQVDFKLVSDSASTSNSEQVVQDPFMIEPIVGCSKVLSGKKVELFKNLPERTTKFSFQANFDYGSQMFEGLVAYDAGLSSLRFDVMNKLPPKSPRRQLFNLKLNRVYHIVQKELGQHSGAMNTILELGSTDGISQSGAVGDSSQCMIAKIIPPSASYSPEGVEKRFSIGKLLLGSDSWIYMGKARVRNINALVYESYDGSVPFWLEPPVVYKTSDSDEEKMRESEKSMKPDGGTSLHVLLYVTETDTPEEEQRVLLIELFEFQDADFSLKSKRMISVYDFSWQINQQMFEESNPTDLFSLEDLCSSDLVGQNEYASVELLLEHQEGSDLSGGENQLIAYLLEAVANDRNIALLSSLQEELILPATMIYDLESRVMKQPLPSGDNKLFVVTTFRVAEHSDSLTELIYLGQGIMKYPFYGLAARSRSFHSCFSLASHRRANIYFGYNHKTGRCAITLTPIPDESPRDRRKANSSKELELRSFSMDPNEHMEIYRINHVLDSDSEHLKASRWIRTMIHNRSKAELIGTQLQLLFPVNQVTIVQGKQVISRRSEMVPFIVRRVQLDERDLKSSIPKGGTIFDELQGDTISTRRINGFGLIYSEKGNRRISPDPLNSYNWAPADQKLKDASSTMTYDQCHAACLSQQNCQSFSVCIIDGQMQCVTSESSFKSLAVIETLEKLLKSAPHKRGEKVTVHILAGDDDTPIEMQLVQQPTCDLYNLAFMDHFLSEPLETKITIGRNVFVPARNEEECAEICIKSNIRVLVGDTGSAYGMDAVLGLTEASDEEVNEKLNTILEDHRQATKRFQRGFFYLDALRFSNLPAETKMSIVEETTKAPMLTGRLLPTPEELEGYCVIQKSKLAKTQEVGDVTNLSRMPTELVELDMYKMKFNIFFEKQYGVRLAESELNEQELEAYKTLRTVGDHYQNKSAAFKTIRSLYDKSANFQKLVYADEINCAQMCFLQIWGGPWPACRSFDLVTDVSKNQYISRCYLNSISLHQAISAQRLDLIIGSEPLEMEKKQGSTKEYTEVWHFEPRAGFISDEFKYSSQLAMAAEESLISSLLNGLTGEGFRLYGWGTFFIVLLGLVCGTLLGIMLGSKFLNLKSLSGGDDDDALVEPRHSISMEFNNIVNQEGRIDP